MIEVLVNAFAVLAVIVLVVSVGALILVGWGGWEKP